jgi:uncharacterized membrane protein YozB (DUF420 family)
MQQQVMVPIAPQATGRLKRVDRWFYVNVALLMILFNAAAFGPSIIDPTSRNAPLPLSPLVTIHAIVSAGWLLLFLAQAALVATGRTAVHRRLGSVAVVLTVVFVVVGGLTIIEQARRGFDLSGDIGRLAPPPGVSPVANTVGLLFFLLNFAILVGAALVHRHRPSVHKRLMSLAMLGGLTPTPIAHLIGHWPALQPWAGVIFPVSFVLFVSSSAIYDRLTQGRIHPVSLWVPAAWFAWQILFAVVVLPSASWREFSLWLIR